MAVLIFFPKSISSATNIRPSTSYQINGRQVYVYAKRKNLHNNQKVPLILFMHGTGGSPQQEAIASGWVAKAMHSNMIVISPSYNDYVTYDNVPYITKVVQYAQKHYSADPQRTYSLGFSNGGATSIAMVNDHPRMFAGIAAYGWANDLQKRQSKYSIPFQFISGTREATEYTRNGNPMVRVDIRTALRTLFRYNKMDEANVKPSYQQTPYWGYKPNSTSKKIVNGKTWTINNYQKRNYQSPFAQLIMINGAGHSPHRAEADYSWNFLKHFTRNSQGQVIEK